MSEAGEIACGGWRIAAGYASNIRPEILSHFYAIYGGDAFGNSGRGIVGVMTQAHPESGGPAKGAREAAQLVVHSFAEGYFGAQRTLSARRAANLSLDSINSWLFSQIRTDTRRRFAPVSLAALIFNGAQIGVLNIGACRLYRDRRGVLTPLMRTHGRVGHDGRFEPARAVGLDLELSVDYAEERAETGDRYLLINGLDAENPEAVQTAFGLDMMRGNGPDIAALVLDIQQAPPPDAEIFNAALAALPLRPAPREGDVWDGFVIGHTVYQGRYTVLKFARDTIENRDVVLKIPFPLMLQDEVFSAGFMREAWIGSTVRGNIVARYIELPPERRSSLYLVMPYYRGETLEARLNRAPPISLPEGIGIALKLCEAVQDLAAIQIVHRDIKPDNIMLMARNEVKLLDLGLAYLPGIDLADAVKPGGTLRYMAPELLRGVQANARSEVYALGVTIYRMFAAGAYPFGQREGVPLARMRPDLPSWLGRILQTALQPDPADRFANASDFAKALHEGLVSGMADEARPSRFPRPTKLQIYQMLTVIFAAGILFLLIRAWR